MEKAASSSRESNVTISLRLPKEIIKVIEDEVMGKIFSKQWTACVNQIIVAYLSDQHLLTKAEVSTGKPSPLTLEIDLAHYGKESELKRIRVPYSTLKYLSEKRPIAGMVYQKAATAIRIVIIQWLSDRGYLKN